MAELVAELVPGAERVRFSKTGCDVTTAAVRLARAFTGRDRVLCCGYHGWHDWYIGVTTDRERGSPRRSRTDLDLPVQRPRVGRRAAIDDETACVILEPMVFEAPKARIPRRG